jgi:AAA15 family ATPase/GTPase
MDLLFTGKYKSLTDFEWLDIPMFSVITGENGTGKSQLLKLIYNTIVNHPQERERLIIRNENFQRNEAKFIQSEWTISNTGNVDLFSIQQKRNSLFSNFRNRTTRADNIGQIELFQIFQDINNKTGNNPQGLSQEEFNSLLPEVIIEQEHLLGQSIAEIFYNYRLSEIDLKAEGKRDTEIVNEIGEKPWIVLKEILKESKLPFLFNDPSENKIRDSFKLKVINEITEDSIEFNDLSSGEKVLISLVFYLYNSQEKSIFPKLLLLDEPDAHLHPTMAQQFLNVVKNVLVDKFAVRVIMTTHSPSTVILTDESSLFEMSRTAPRIKKSNSKNGTIQLLTSGLVYIGKGTRYFLVEDEDDSDFYSYLYDHLTSEKIVVGDIPLVFIKSSTSNKSGGKLVVQDWVKKLQDSGLETIIQGIIDADNGNFVSQGVYKIERYSIENYLIDPIVTYAALMDREKHMELLDIGLKVGEEYKLKSLPAEQLQNIADTIFRKVEPLLSGAFSDYSSSEVSRETVTFTNGLSLEYPKWIFHRRGKTLLNEVYQKSFSHKIVNFTFLFKALRKVNFIPCDIVDLFNKVKE